MNSRLKPRIEIVFPELSAAPGETPSEFVERILQDLDDTGRIETIGYAEDDDLRRSLLERLSGYEASQYASIDDATTADIRRRVGDAFARCVNEHLLRDETIIYVFPYMPKERDASIGSIDAVAAYVGVLHLYVDIKSADAHEYESTIAHEYGHLLHYEAQGNTEFTLLERMVSEGIAEKFRESVVGGAIAPWSDAIDDDEARATLMTLEDRLDSYDRTLYADVFFGNDDFKRWSGHSIGYRIIDSVIRSGTRIDWGAIAGAPAREHLRTYLGSKRT